ncbi:MAG: heme-binding domain-containing protein [Bacteroidales bacterium]|nr:heme-binding domain-containing protein [Bacteroidales bacterium]
MQKVIRYIILIFLVALVVIQFVPANLPVNDPPAGYDFFEENNVPSDVQTLLKNACYDCHSQEVTYPWYSHVAPFSWLIAQDVRHGRHNIDFSNWELLSKRDKLNILDEISDEVRSGGMPLKAYVRLHPSADLTDDEQQTIIRWADEMAENLFNE